MGRTILACFTLKLCQLIYYSKKTHQKSRALSYLYKTRIDKWLNMCIFMVDQTFSYIQNLLNTDGFAKPTTLKRWYTESECTDGKTILRNRIF